MAKKGCTRLHEKILQKIGRLKEKYKKVSKFYEITVIADDQNKNTIERTWIKKDDASSYNNAGMYCLRSNRLDLDEATFWNIHTMLYPKRFIFRC